MLGRKAVFFVAFYHCGIASHKKDNRNEHYGCGDGYSRHQDCHKSRDFSEA